MNDELLTKSPSPKMPSSKPPPSMPTIIVDNREQRPLIFDNLPSEPGTLQSGDYSIAGLERDFAIERKSIADLCQSVTRGRDRFERELHRLRGFAFARVLIVGSPHEVQRQAQNAKAIFGSISAMECRWSVPFVWEADPGTAARLVERWAWFFHRERFPHRVTCPIPAATVQGHTMALTAASRHE